MFNLKISLLITIASQACLALKPWQDALLKGDCGSFGREVEGVWNDETHSLARIISENYKGDLNMAHKIYNCLVRLSWPESKSFENNTFHIYEDSMIGYLALYRALSLEDQEETEIAVETATRMRQLVDQAESHTEGAQLDILKIYVEEFQDAMLPTFKEVHFSEWVYIINPDKDLYLTMYEGKVEMWPRDVDFIPENTFKWNIHRISAGPPLQVTFANAENGLLLASNDKGEVVTTQDRTSGYHLWDVEFAKVNSHDAGAINLKNNKLTGKYLQADLFRIATVEGEEYQVLPLTLYDRNGLYLTLDSY